MSADANGHRLLTAVQVHLAGNGATRDVKGWQFFFVIHFANPFLKGADFD
jgi:hypothetical protein